MSATPPPIHDDPHPSGQADPDGGGAVDGDLTRVTPQVDPSPKGLVLFWCTYLLAGWSIALHVDQHAHGFGPWSVQWIVFLAALGMMVVWPAYRLSLHVSIKTPDGQHVPVRIRPAWVLYDWLCLYLVLQIVMMLPYFGQPWSQRQVVWTDIALAGWTLLSALIVAVGLRSGTGLARVIAMLVCVLLVLGEPAAMALLDLVMDAHHSLRWPMRVSPLEAIWSLTRPSHDAVPQPWPAIAVNVLIGAGLGWVILLWQARRDA